MFSVRDFWGPAYGANLAAIRNAALHRDFGIVISGATGWFGTALIELLMGHDPAFWRERLCLLGSRNGMFKSGAGIDLPVSDLACRGACKRFKGRPIIAFHFAFLTKDRGGEFSDAEYQDRNDQIRASMLAQVEEAECTDYVLASSGAVYDVLEERDGLRQPYIRQYGEAKVRDEIETCGYFAGSKTKVIIPRIFNVSGPYSNKINEYALSSFVAAALQGRDIIIESPKQVYRSYLYIFDLLIALLIMILDARRPAIEIFDASFFPEIENELLARLVTEKLGARSGIRFRHPERLEVDRYVGDGTSLTAFLKEHDIEPLPLERQVELTANYISSR